jgi:hypothetical protein
MARSTFQCPAKSRTSTTFCCSTRLQTMKIFNVVRVLGRSLLTLSRPACSTCTTNGRACSYDANVKKRGLPEGYVRGLEKLWGLAIREIDTVEDSILVALSGDEDSKQRFGSVQVLEV